MTYRKTKLAAMITNNENDQSGVRAASHEIYEVGWLSGIQERIKILITHIGIMFVSQLYETKS